MAEDVGTVDELVDSADRGQGADLRVGDAGGQRRAEAFGVENPALLRERGVEEADSDALEEAKNAHRDRYSEAQMIAPETYSGE
ncbi:hypothetical protein [Streptomyces sp. NPDC055013]